MCTFARKFNQLSFLAHLIMNDRMMFVKRKEDDAQLKMPTVEESKTNV